MTLKNPLSPYHIPRFNSRMLRFTQWYVLGQNTPPLYIKLVPEHKFVYFEMNPCHQRCLRWSFKSILTNSCNAKTIKYLGFNHGEIFNGMMYTIRSAKLHFSIMNHIWVGCKHFSTVTRIAKFLSQVLTLCLNKRSVDKTKPWPSIIVTYMRPHWRKQL